MPKANELIALSLPIIGFAAFILALAFSIAPAQADKPSQETEAYCLSCHSNPDLSMTLPSGEVLSLFVSPEVLQTSVHNPAGIEC